LSSVTWYWSITHSSALRLPRRYSKRVATVTAFVTVGFSHARYPTGTLT
jgi:hypothetical protein